MFILAGIFQCYKGCFIIINLKLSSSIADTKQYLVQHYII